MSTFVSVGNALQPFTRLVEAVGLLSARLPQPVIIQHGHTPPAGGACRPVAFMNMEEFIRHVHEAELLIMHAGAGSVIHAIEAGKVPVLMARRADYGEHVNDHQLEFASVLAGVGRVVLAESPEDLVRAVDEAMHRQRLVSSNGRGAAPGALPPLVSIVKKALDEFASRSAFRDR